jgi:hypothetical protein
MEGSTNYLDRDRTLWALVFFLCFFSQQAIAGCGWTPEKKKGFFKLSQYMIKANSHYTDNGETDPNLTIAFYNTSFYGEIGITDRWAIISNLSLFARNLHNEQVSGTTGEVVMPGEAINGFGDMDLAVKYSIVKKEKVAFAGSFLIGIPSGKTGKGELEILQLGDGEFNQQIRFDVSNPFSIGRASMYSNIYAGFNNRTKGFSEEFKWGVEMGAGLIKQHLWITGKIDGSQSFRNGKSSSEGNSMSVFANNAEYISYSIQTSARVYKGFGFSFNYSSAFYARIILASPTYTVGVFYDLK